MKIRIKNAAICLCLALLMGPVVADEHTEEAHVLTMQTFKIKWSDIDSYLEVYEREWLPLVKQNEYILSHNIYQHAWGPDWTLLIVEEYRSMGDFVKAREEIEALWQAKYPDASDRNAADREFDRYVDGHFDSIVTKRPGYSK